MMVTMLSRSKPISLQLALQIHAGVITRTSAGSNPANPIGCVPSLDRSEIRLPTRRRLHLSLSSLLHRQLDMELDRVDILVNGLTSAYESGLDFYLRWKRQLESQNHYRRHQGTSSTAAKDAVSTSLDMSSHRIRATYQVGFALIGPDFSAGDGIPSHLCARRNSADRAR